MKPDSDDQVIAIAFRRSLAVIFIAAVVVGGFVVTRHLMQPEVEPVTEANVIAPQVADSINEPSPRDVQFTDITESAGITHSHRSGAYGDRLLPETMGGGVAFLDYNNDGATDLLFINGRTWPWRDDANDESSLLLYSNDGAGRFADVTADAGLDVSLYGMGAASGDYDGDGDVDLFITAVGSNRLLRNVSGDRFEDVTSTAGVAGADDAWSTGAAFVDIDNDSDLDLVVLNYVEWSREIDFEVDYRLTGIGRAYGPPSQYAGTHSYLYRNNGDGTFSDISEPAGLLVSNPATGLPLGKALAVLPTDVNADGWTDLVVANDTVQNFLFLNQQGQRFVETGSSTGVAFDNSGAATGAMGIDNAYFSTTDEHALAVGNFANEMTSLFVQSQGSQVFTDQAIVTGVGPASRQALTFGLFFFDYDLNQRLDLLQANGHVENDINVVQPSQHYAQPPQLFWNCGLDCARQFVPVEFDAANGLAKPIVGRGAAYADIDRDGDQDVVLTQIDAPPRLLRNDQATGHNWVQFDIRDANGAPALGAIVELSAGGHLQRRRVETSRSYLSQVEPLLTFGLGNVEQVNTVEVRWPGGATTVISSPDINERHAVSPETTP